MNFGRVAAQLLQLWFGDLRLWGRGRLDFDLFNAGGEPLIVRPEFVDRALLRNDRRRSNGGEGHDSRSSATTRIRVPACRDRASLRRESVGFRPTVNWRWLQKRIPWQFRRVCGGGCPREWHPRQHNRWRDRARRKAQYFRAAILLFVPARRTRFG